MDEALRTKLLSNAALAALVRSISWDERPRTGLMPAIILTLVTPGREYDHEGWDGLNDTRVQIDIWAQDGAGASGADTVRRIADAIPAAIEPEETVAGWVIGPAFLDSDDASSEDLNGERVFRRRQDWMIMNRPI